MLVLKKYVQNRGQLEGCVAQGWGTQEIVEFTVDYIDLKEIGYPLSRHEGRLKGKWMLGHSIVRSNDYVLFTQVHFIFLQQSIIVDPYVNMHVQLLWSTNSTKSED